mmetsp:Transcript_4608/g.6022  ORF Transcript_4608/g.6022 Transcript_4608/m.6022 type:complete len:84 (-) Transcript_4608:3-254(-)
MCESNVSSVKSITVSCGTPISDARVETAKRRRRAAVVVDHCRNPVSGAILFFVGDVVVGKNSLKWWKQRWDEQMRIRFQFSAA